MSSDATPKIVHDEKAEEFEINMGGRIALLSYEKTGRVMNIQHTEVPAEFEGEGVGASLVRSALEHARENGLTVVPSCPFAALYIRRHPEYQDLVGS